MPAVLVSLCVHSGMQSSSNTTVRARANTNAPLTACCACVPHTHSVLLTHLAALGILTCCRVRYPQLMYSHEEVVALRASLSSEIQRLGNEQNGACPAEARVLNHLKRRSQTESWADVVEAKEHAKTKREVRRRLAVTAAHLPVRPEAEATKFVPLDAMEEE